MNKFEYFIHLIFSVKLIFILLALSEKYLKISGKKDTDIDKNIEYWRERIEFIFTILMAILMIYLFNPRINRDFLINGETKLLLFLFGFILIFTAKWNIFLEESKWFVNLKEILV